LSGYCGDSELGSISSLGAITTYATPVPSTSSDQLTAAPDGQLLNSEPTDVPIVNGHYQPTNNGTLWAITLPDVPRPQAPTLRLLSAVSHARSAVVTLHCSGQPGRYCSGTITLRAAKAATQAQAYAVEPDYTTTYTIASVHQRLGTHATLTVTNTDLGGRTIQRLSATVHTLR
jgi:hypothetical protein